MDRISLHLELSPAMADQLDSLSVQLGASPAHVLRKAIALLRIAAQAKAEGLRLGIVPAGTALTMEIVGL
jgi:hypothetical protein